MIRRCLIHVFAPQNMIPAVSAVRWFGESQIGKTDADAVILIHMPGWNEEQHRRIAPIIARQAASQGWMDVRYLTDDQMNQIVGPSGNPTDSVSLARFREMLGFSENYFTEIYFSHSIVGHAAQVCMGGFPTAKRITYGEGFGLMEDKEYVIASTTGMGWDEETQHLRRRVELEATKAVLILPADQTGDCLADKELIIVPRAVALSVIDDFQQTSPELVSYTQEVLKEVSGLPYLFMAANLADMGAMSQEAEAAMYAELIQSYAPPGSVVLIKAHPLGSARVDELVAEKLRSSHQAKVLSTKFNRYPIEMWRDLISACQVISLSTGAITLEYLFGKPVIYGFNSEILLKYLSERVLHRFIEGDALHRLILENLSRWDGKSVIASGRRRSSAPAAGSPSIHRASLAEEINQRALAFLQTGQVESALQALEHGLRISPCDGILLQNLGVLNWNALKPVEAITYLLLAWAERPDDRQSAVNAVQVLRSVGNSTAARSVCFKYLQSNPVDTEISELYKQL